MLQTQGWVKSSKHMPGFKMELWTFSGDEDTHIDNHQPPPPTPPRVCASVAAGSNMTLNPLAHVALLSVVAPCAPPTHTWSQWVRARQYLSRGSSDTQSAARVGKGHVLSRRTTRTTCHTPPLVRTLQRVWWKRSVVKWLMFCLNPNMHCSV